jgi:hypothetical protein
LWFFAVDGCNEFVKNKLKDIPEGKLQIDIRITNSNGSEFSSEETGIIYFIGFLSTVNTILLLYYYRILRLDEEKNEELNYPLAILVFSILLDNLRNYSYFVHLIAYAFNGFGITPLLLLSEICEVVFA